MQVTEAVFFVMLGTSSNQLGTRLSVVFLYTSCLARNELVGTSLHPARLKIQTQLCVAIEKIKDLFDKNTF